MTLQKVKQLLAIARDKSAQYIKGEGATCPVCMFLGAQFSRVPVRRTDGNIRYHQCLVCGTNFKSIETDLKIEIKSCTEAKIKSGSIPEKKDKPATFKHTKSRSRKK